MRILCFTSALLASVLSIQASAVHMESYYMQNGQAIDHSYQPMNLLQLDGDSNADSNTLSDALEAKL